MNNFTDKTLGELLSDSDEVIRRNAMSILKQLQRSREGGSKSPETKWKFQEKHKTEWKNEEKH